jgi:hypothetical protein
MDYARDVMNPLVTKQLAEGRMDRLRRAADAHRQAAQVLRDGQRWDLNQRVGALLIRVGRKLAGPEAAAQLIRDAASAPSLRSARSA